MAELGDIANEADAARQCVFKRNHEGVQQSNSFFKEIPRITKKWT